MRCFSIIETPQNLGGFVFLLVFVAVIAQATEEETTNECDRDNTCWYVQPEVITVSERSWRCLWIWKCWTYEVDGPPDIVCHCCPGWKGDVSDCQRCPAGNFGYNCKEECKCTDYTYCDSRNGACYSEALDKTFVDNCSGVNCTKGQICNRSTNQCDCPTMWTGDRCETHSRCPKDHYGETCDSKCHCNSETSQCDMLTGECVCYPGWMGPECNETCLRWSYGENCSMSCDCPTNASECDPVSGDCLCPAGYYDTSCSSDCPDGRFGPSCQFLCTCDNYTETCNRINGTCTDKDYLKVYGDDGILVNSLAGPVLGAIVASVIFVALLVIIILFLIRRSKRANQTRETLAVKSSGITVNPGYDNPINFVDDRCTSNSQPLHHFAVGGATYAMPDNATLGSSCCNADAPQDFEVSYNHLQPTPGHCINPNHCGEQNDYSHLTRDDQRFHGSCPLADSSPDALYADTNRVIQSKAIEYDNLNRGVKQPDGVTKYEVVIL